MKNLLVGTLILSATTMLAAPQPKPAVSRPAQSAVNPSAQRVEAVIPFRFRAGKAVLPAGTYVFTFDSVSQTGWIENVEGRAKVVSLNAYVKPGAEPRLEFKRDGNMMVLQPGSGGENANRRTAVAGLHGQSPAAGVREGR